LIVKKKLTGMIEYLTENDFKLRGKDKRFTDAADDRRARLGPFVVRAASERFNGFV
jgi:hypothetical protein